MYRLQSPLLVMAVLLGLFFSAEQGEAGDTIMPAQCCRCHGDVCQQSDTRHYVHAPFLENNCAVCHVRGGLSSLEPAVVAEESPDEISWFAGDCRENQEHWFELPSSLTGTTISLWATAGTGKTPADHLALTDSRFLTITVCVGCHPQSHGVRSHPVDITPKAGMVIPPDYQTLADGRLSCMSCHQAHASEHEYRLTRASRKELCLGCHRNFG